MTDKERKLLPVLGVVVLFGVYWMFIRDDGSGGSKRRPRPKPPVAKPTQPAKPGTAVGAPDRATPPPTTVVGGAADAGVNANVSPPADARPPQTWKVVARTGGRVRWVADKGNVLLGDVVVKYRGYRDAERQRERYEKRLQRQRASLHATGDKLRKAMNDDDKEGMRRYERRLQGAQSEVESTQSKLSRAQLEVSRLSVRAPGSGEFTPEIKQGDTVKPEQPVGVVKER